MREIFLPRITRMTRINSRCGVIRSNHAGSTSGQSMILPMQFFELDLRQRFYSFNVAQSATLKDRLVNRASPGRIHALPRAFCEVCEYASGEASLRRDGSRSGLGFGYLMAEWWAFRAR